MKNTIKSETAAEYIADQDDAIIAQALEILRKRYARGAKIGSPTDLRKYLALKFGDLEHEAFSVIYVDTQHQIIAHDVEFTGTLDSCSVYPREIVKAAIRHNCSAVILAHNHPSGSAEPSRADRSITDQLKSSLDLIGVRVLDHIVTGGDTTVSFAERGWL